ncbi:MAG: hypothetical protein ABIG95_02410 [Candidatus Woesearchaeota archaeon]
MLRAQASIEYLTVFSLVFVILIPTVYVFQDYSARSSKSIVDDQVRIIGNDIVNAAETAYYMGQPSRLTLEETMPRGIALINITSDWSNNYNEIMFVMDDGRALSFFCSVNINASITQEDYSAGLKYVVVETRNTSTQGYVYIDIR